jgi:RNA polymerase sigma-70 factor (ECF subfamily)
MAIYVDDRELVAAHQAGDTEAFEELVREHRLALISHASRKLNCNQAAEDALQETLVRAYRALPKFNGEYRLGPWLHRIMSNVCIDEVNRRRRDVEKVERVSATPSARMSAPSVEEELDLHVDLSFLETAIRDLPKTHRDAFVHRVIDELGYDELADAAGVSEENARARVSRARAMLRASLKGVAALPVLLVGLLKRGEKAAAAASHTGEGVLATATGVSGATTLTTAATHAVVSGAATTPLLAGAAVTAAPAAIPVVAKAAVGLGLAAAVLTPTSDSAVHQAAENFVSSAGMSQVESADGDSSNPGDPVVLGSDVSQSQLAIASTEAAASGGQSQDVAQTQIIKPQVLETLSPSLPTGRAAETTDSDRRSEQQNVSSAGLQGSESPSVIGAGVAGALTGLMIDISESGPGQFELSGDVTVLTDDSSLAGTFDQASRIRMTSQVNNGNGRRLDALFIIGLTDGSRFEMRIAGFAIGGDENLQINGLFRVSSSALNIAEEGNFTGSLNLGVNGNPGALAITFTP